MYLFLDRLWVKKGGNLSGGKIFPYHIEYFPHAANLDQLFLVLVAFVDKIIRGNIIYGLFNQLVINMGKYLPQKRKVCENNSCLTALFFFFRGPFGFSANIPHIKLIK